MNRIEVTQRIGRETKTVYIDADQLDYIKPGLADCSVHFIDGSHLVITESEGQLRKLLRGNSKNPPGE